MLRLFALYALVPLLVATPINAALHNPPDPLCWICSDDVQKVTNDSTLITTIVHKERPSNTIALTSVGVSHHKDCYIPIKNAVDNFIAKNLGNPGAEIKNGLFHALMGKLVGVSIRLHGDKTNKRSLEKFLSTNGIESELTHILEDLKT